MNLFMIIMLCLLVGYSAVITWGCWNLISKNEALETALEDCYERTNTVLETIKSLDSKKMFEEDDDVGSVFRQIVEVISVLDKILTEEVDENTK